ncbi:glucosamine-6-phosphate deaminase [Aerococcus urinaehominis]|uniref:Glucosamine-6-phosphate deaminase n=1 Tax=Aerococcus urinaehominis TaxID=128944 RepID=A0A0X8FLF4_9LACT|nr:glucosamine-6-phosphate deaminase [Aerococcus urinaehominis]AMB99244.1 glucosamine-6-phosphate deaminase [Aerococcus urinaehominis]SDM31248.1 glucosamine-6-phosphate deaminase [Aerococcus urinaehominis]
MEIKIFDNQALVSEYGAQLVTLAKANGAQTFGLATGSSPEEIYAHLSQSNIDFSDSVSVNLDEYCGLAPDHPQSYHYFMHEKLFKYKPFAKSFVPNGSQSDTSLAIAEYLDVLHTYPRDFQILGLGENGHIAFNEPGTPFGEEMIHVQLTPSTVEVNSRFFGPDEVVPDQAYSMGIKAIMQAQEIMMLAFGERKAQAVKEMIEGPVTENIPASVLQLHPNVTVLLDQAAASQLSQA